MNKYINANAVKLDIRRYLMPNVDDDGTVTVENAERHFLNLLDNAPAEEVEKVVHCRNCIHYKANINKENYCDVHSTRWDKFYVRDDDYCSYGERRKID